VLLAGFLIIPLTVFGSTYADMRLVPFLFAVAVLAIRFRGETPLPLARMLAVCGLVFLVIRFAGNGISLAMAADDQRAKLEAIDHMPMGARTVTLAGQPCKREWALPRNTHLGAMVIVRRHGFSNDQWVIEGINLLQLNYRPAGRFAADPSQIVQADHCRPAKMWTMSEALAAFPRDRFDYLWLIDPPPYDPAAVNDLRPVWRGPGSILYQVER